MRRRCQHGARPGPVAGALPCGRNADTVAEHAATGTSDEHERECPYCGAIIAGTAAVDAAALALARDTDADPSPGLVPAVMHTVWSELRPGRRIPLPSGGGATFATETALISAITGALDLIDDLTVRRIRFAAAGADGTELADAATEDTADVHDPAVLPAVSLTASARYPADIPALAADARAAVVLSSQQLFGLTPLRVDIEITDLQPPVQAS